MKTWIQTKKEVIEILTAANFPEAVTNIKQETSNGRRWFTVSVPNLPGQMRSSCEFGANGLTAPVWEAWESKWAAGATPEILARVQAVSDLIHPYNLHFDIDRTKYTDDAPAVDLLKKPAAKAKAAAPSAPALFADDATPTDQECAAAFYEQEAAPASAIAASIQRAESCLQTAQTDDARESIAADIQFQNRIADLIGEMPPKKSDTPTGKNTNQTGGQLSADMDSAIFESSRSIVHTTRSGNKRGLQQFFTPRAAADLIHAVLSSAYRQSALDLTAGDGSLLAPWGDRYGIEIDKAQVLNARRASRQKAARREKEREAKRAAERGEAPALLALDSDENKTEDDDGGEIHGEEYFSCVGDLQRLYPLLKMTGQTFPTVLLNPPFGLVWNEAGYAGLNNGKQGNSTLLAFEMGLGLLDSGGQGAIILGKNRVAALLENETNRRAVYAQIDVEGLFPGVDLPTSILFFADPEKRKRFGMIAYWALVKAGTLAECAPDLIKQITNARADQFGGLPMAQTFSADAARSVFGQIEHEAERRAKQERGERAPYDVQIVGGKIRVDLSPLAYTTCATSDISRLLNLRDNRANYFALNGKDWKHVCELADAGKITVSAADRAAVGAIVEDAKTAILPVYPLKPQQRLAYLSDMETLRCIEGDALRGFEAGESYSLKVESDIKKSDRTEYRKDSKGEMQAQVWIRKEKVMKITLGGRETFSEDKADIEYLMAHFDLPDPGDLATHFPVEMDDRRATLRELESRMKENVRQIEPTHRFVTDGFKEYQIEDIARLLMKKGGILSWEQGLGKSVGSMAFAEASFMRREVSGDVLFPVPQDLIPQWQREARLFFGREMIRIQTPAQARAIAREIKDDPFHLPTWYVVGYEALALVGTQTPAGLGIPTERGVALRPHFTIGKIAKKITTEGYYTDPDPETWKREWIEPSAKWVRKAITSETVCPQCLSRQQVKLAEPTEDGRTFTTITRAWNGKVCECGYVHKSCELKSVGSYLATAFKQGVVIPDEGTKIKGDSLQSKAVRGLRARRKLLLTGTPQKNYVCDLYWLLGWSLGFNSVKFPFAYNGGYEKFKDDFCVVEQIAGKGREKILPEVTNLSVLWKMLSSSIVRRRKEQSGEQLVDRTFVPVTTPMGEAQKKQYQFWLDNFKSWYAARNGDKTAEEIQASYHMPQLAKLEWATTLPATDPDADAGGFTLSNMTPKNLKVLELAAMHAARGEKVLIGSDLMMTGPFLAAQLTRQGIKAAHIVESVGDKNGTMSPAKRAATIAKFQAGDTSVLCAGVNSVAYGHNMDKASVVILTGLPWDYATLDQFIARVHRLSSKKPVTIYVVMADGSLDQRKWQLLGDKGKSADLSLDGELSEKKTKEVSMKDVLDELVKRGLPDTATVSEADCIRMWDSFDATSGAFLPVEGPAARFARLDVLDFEDAAPASKPEPTPAPELVLQLVTPADVFRTRPAYMTKRQQMPADFGGLFA